MPQAATRADSLRLTLASVEILSLSAVGTISGVVILAAAGRNGQGDGRLRSTGDGSLLSWRAPGSLTYGTPVRCSANGTYLLEDGEDPGKWIRVQVYASYLMSMPTVARVDLQDRIENGISHDDVTAAEATAGDVTTYTITLENDNAVNLSGLRVWLAGGRPAYRGLWGLLHAGIAGYPRGSVELSLDNATWYRPLTEATALVVPDLVAGGSDTLYVRRTVATGAPSAASALRQLRFAFNAI